MSLTFGYSHFSEIPNELKLIIEVQHKEGMITNDLFRDTQNSKLYISKLTPEFLRSSISNYSKYENARSQTPLVQLLIAESLKASGNRLYKSGMLRDALNVYQEAISIFRYLVPTNLRWKDEGRLRDEMITRSKS